MPEKLIAVGEAYRGGEPGWTPAPTGSMMASTRSVETGNHLSTVPLSVLMRLRTQVAPVHLLIRMEPSVACAGDVTEKQSFSWAVAAATPMTSIPAASITIRIMLFPPLARMTTA
jgi:hypothetical protein